MKSPMATSAILMIFVVFPTLTNTVSWLVEICSISPVLPSLSSKNFLTWMVVEDISVIVPIYAFGLLRTCVSFSWTFSLIDSEDEVAVWAFRNFKDEEKSIMDNMITAIFFINLFCKFTG